MWLAGTELGIGGGRGSGRLARGLPGIEMEIGGSPPCLVDGPLLQTLALLRATAVRTLEAAGQAPLGVYGQSSGHQGVDTEILSHGAQVQLR